MKKNRILRTIQIVCGLLLLLVIYLTWQAIVETDNWRWFDIDYTNQDKVITGYGALLAAIISTTSIVLLVYTIYLQIRESKKQSKRFKKEYGLQKQQFEEEKKREERKEKLDLYYKLKLISVFLESIIKHIEETALEIRKFIDAEKTSPLGMNTLYFLVNKNMAKLIEMDYLAIFIAFKEFLKTEDHWTKNFNNLFSLVGFYKDALNEVRENYKYHSKDKFERKSQITLEIKNMLDYAVKINTRYKQMFVLEKIHPYSQLIDRMVSEYYEVVNRDNDLRKESDLDKLSQEIFLRFIQEVLELRKVFGLDENGMEELLVSISSIRKNIYKLKFDCNYFVNDLEKRYNDYFSPESEHLKELKALKEYIDEQLDKIDPDKL